jgi:hypothetical protein
MKKHVAWIGCLLAVCLAAPSLAYEVTYDGMYRVRMIMADLQADKDKSADTLVDQRARLGLKMKIDEYLQFSYIGEIDIQYGDAGYATARNQGGGIAGDSVNLETKNLYAKLTLPDTPYSAAVGLQGFRDNWSFALALVDVAGVSLSADTDKFNVKAGWYKLLEGDGNANHTIGLADTQDDVTLWALQTNFNPSEKLRFNLDGYYVKNEGSQQIPNLFLLGSSEDLYYLGGAVKYAFPAMNLSAWGFYNFGTSYDAASDGGDLDISAFAAAARADFKIGGVKAGVRGIYFAGDDDATDNDRSAVRIPWATDGVPLQESVPFFDSGLMIMLPDKFGTTYHNGAGFGMAQAYNEFGLIAITADASYSPQSQPNFYLNGAVGHFVALEENRLGLTARQGNNIGSEICTRVGYKIGKHTDISLNGAYAVLGDFFDGTATGGQDPDNQYEVYTMLNVFF